MGVVSKKGQKRNNDLKEAIQLITGMSPDGKENALDAIRLAVNAKDSDADWRIRACSPKTGPIITLLNAFRAETDAPLELPFFCAVHLISGLLLKNGSTLSGPIGTITPEVWTIVLAPSGSCKTLTHKLISAQAPISSDFPECASSAAFFEALKKAQDEQGFALWFQDEFAQILKQIETPNSPLSEAKSYLLRAYGNDRIVRTTKKSGEIVIERPCLGIFALNTVESFVEAISMESMLDGFAQRFGMVLAREDMNRPMTDFALYDTKVIESVVAGFWNEISGVRINLTYRLGEDAIKFYKQSFRMLHDEKMNKSFYRRIMFRAFKYAMIFHVLLKKEGEEIDTEDMAYAMDLVKLHLQDMNQFICLKTGIKSVVDIGRKAKFTIDIAKRAGKSVKARDLTQNLRQDIGNAEEAKFFLDLFHGAEVKSVPKDQTPFG